MRSDQDENVLEKDVLIVDGKAQKTSCGSSSQEEEDRLEYSPSRPLVNLGDQSVEFLTTDLRVQNSEPSKQQS